MSVFGHIARPHHGFAWVTGASEGIGRALVRELAARGWEVWATARSEDKLRILAEENPSQVFAAPGDVTDPEAMREIVARITETRPLALAVLNAGVYLPMRAQDFSAEKARKTFDVNLGGVANGLEPVLRHMIAEGKGHVALTASSAGFRGLPRAAAYSATKAGLIAMAEALAFDLIDLGVRISVINPGFVETEATGVNDFDMPMLMKPEEAAKSIADGLERGGFEIAFPWIFTRILRLIGRLPNQAYFWTVRKLTGWKDVQD